MSLKTTLALLGGATFLFAPHQALAIDAVTPAAPSVIYAGPPVPQPMRTAYVQPQRSSMGGGFIEFLFSGAPSSQDGYQQPTYQQQPDYYRGRGLPPMDPQM